MSPPKRARASGPDIALRRIFVSSSARAGAAQTARAKKLARAAGDLDRLMHGLGSRHYPDEAAVRTRLAVIGKTRRVASLLKATAAPIRPPGNQLSPGNSTPRRSRPRRPPTAGMRCWPIWMPPTPTPPRC
jgi:hypothetical protein